MGMPGFRVFTGCTHQPEVCPVGFQRSDHQPHNPLFPIGKRHRLMMHRVVETHLRSSEMHPANDRGRFQFSGGGQDNGSRNSMIGEVAGVLRAIARFIARLFVN